jgi:hypothetical protein
MGRQFMANQPVRFEAQLKNETGKPLDKNAEVKFKIVPPAGVQLARTEFPMDYKREGEWSGYFRGQVQLNTAGKYELVLPIPGSGEILRREFVVKEANPELDNSRPDFAALEQMASEVSKLGVNDQLKARLRRELRTAIPKSEGGAAPARDVAGDTEPHLFFNLNNARSIPEYLVAESRTIRNKGKVEDLWSDGPSPNPQFSYWTLLGVSIAGFVMAAGLAAAAIYLFVGGKNGTAGLCLGGAVLLGLGAIVYLIAALQYYQRQDVVTTTSALLFVIVGLLSIEWLTRKLLRLA